MVSSVDKSVSGFLKKQKQSSCQFSLLLFNRLCFIFSSTLFFFFYSFLLSMLYSKCLKWEKKWRQIARNLTRKKLLCRLEIHTLTAVLELLKVAGYLGIVQRFRYLRKYSFVDSIDSSVVQQTATPTQYRPLLM